MSRDMLDLLDRRENSPPLTRRERIRLAQGYALATLVVVLFVLFVSIVAAGT